MYFDDSETLGDSGNASWKMDFWTSFEKIELVTQK